MVIMSPAAAKGCCRQPQRLRQSPSERRAIMFAENVQHLIGSMWMAYKAATAAAASIAAFNNCSKDLKDGTIKNS